MLSGAPACGCLKKNKKSAPAAQIVSIAKRRYDRAAAGATVGKVGAGAKYVETLTTVRAGKTGAAVGLATPPPTLTSTENGIRNLSEAASQSQ